MARSVPGSRSGDGDAHHAGHEFLVVDGIALLANARELRLEPARVGDGGRGVAREGCGREPRLERVGREFAQQELADRGAVQRHAAPGLEAKSQRPVRLHAVDVDHVSGGHHAEVARFAASCARAPRAPRASRRRSPPPAAPAAPGSPGARPRRCAAVPARGRRSPASRAFRRCGAPWVAAGRARRRFPRSTGDAFAPRPLPARAAPWAPPRPRRALRRARS